MPDLELLDHFCTQDVDQFPNKTEDILKKKTTYNCIIVYIQYNTQHGTGLFKRRLS